MPKCSFTAFSLAELNTIYGGGTTSNSQFQFDTSWDIGNDDFAFAIPYNDTGLSIDANADFLSTGQIQQILTMEQGRVL